MVIFFMLIFAIASWAGNYIAGVIVIIKKQSVV